MATPLKNMSSEIDLPFALDSIAGIPMSWFRELDAACDVFFAKRGIVYDNGFRAQQHRDATIAIARREKALPQ